MKRSQVNMTKISNSFNALAFFKCFRNYELGNGETLRIIGVSSTASPETGKHLVVKRFHKSHSIPQQHLCYKRFLNQ